MGGFPEGRPEEWGARKSLSGKEKGFLIGAQQRQMHGGRNGSEELPSLLLAPKLVPGCRFPHCKPVKLKGT